jgi:hypothetical protein
MLDILRLAERPIAYWTSAIIITIVTFIFVDTHAEFIAVVIIANLIFFTSLIRRTLRNKSEFIENTRFLIIGNALRLIFTLELVFIKTKKLNQLLSADDPLVTFVGLYKTRLKEMKKEIKQIKRSIPIPLRIFKLEQRWMLLDELAELRKAFAMERLQAVMTYKGILNSVGASSVHDYLEKRQCA